MMIDRNRIRMARMVVLVGMLLVGPLWASFTWTGDGGNNLASTGGNWFGGVAPTGVSTDVIVLDGTSGGNPTKSMTWDVGLTAGSWSQTSSYTGTVTINTTYAGSQTFTVTNTGGASGDVTLDGGTWVHSGNTSSETNRLNVHVDGNLSIGDGGTISASGLGYGINQGLGATGGSGSYRAPSYGGQGGTAGTANNTYGSATTPTNLGSGGANSAGGGAIYLEVDGATTCEGTIQARSGGSDGTTLAGSGGSVYLKTATLSGSGTINVSAVNGNGGSGGSSDAGGGRLAIVLTSGADTGSVDLVSNGGGGSQVKRYGAAGTIYVETASDTPGAGTLIVDNSGIAGQGLTNNVSTAVDYTQFSAIQIAGQGALGVEAADTFSFVTDNVTGSGKASATVNLSSLAGVTLPGGVLVHDDAYQLNIDPTVSFNGGVTIGSNSGMGLNSAATVNGDLIIQSTGLLTHEANTTTIANALDVTVTGDLDLQLGGAIDVQGKGYAAGQGPAGGAYAAYPGGYGGLGAFPLESKGNDQTYGSILDPQDGGSGGASSGHEGGGVVALGIAGDATIDGTIRAEGKGSGNGAGAGGTVNLAIGGTLAGSGLIQADGGGSTSTAGNNYGGGAGRIVIALTTSDDLSALSQNGGGLDVRAEGGTGHGGNKRFGAAGTIYIEGASDSGGNGRVYVNNGNQYDAGSYNAAVQTQIPSANLLTEDLSGTTLVLQARARAGLVSDVTIDGLSIDANSTLAGNNHTLTLNTLSGTGTIEMGTSTTLNFNSSTAVSLDNITLTGTGTVQQSGPGVLTVDTDYGIGLAVNNGTLMIAGGVTVTGDAAVNDGGTLGGDGWVNGTVTVANGGILAPGASPGVLTMTDLVLDTGGALLIEIDGSVADTGYDQLIVSGTVTLAGDLQITGLYRPELDETFTIIDGTSAPIGQFSQGTEIITSLGKFIIDYAGGIDGFDVVLTKVPEPCSLAVLGALGLVGLRRRRR